MEAADSQELALLWHKFKKENDSEARERLILHYVSLVKYVAGRLAIGVKGHFELDDLINAGVYGLINAVDRFDPDRGFKFETFALARIKGAILDWLRAFNWIPQSVRNKARSLERALLSLEQSLGRPPEDHEIAAHLGLTLKQFHQMMDEVAPVTLISLEDSLYSDSDNESYSLGEVIPDPKAKDPVEHLELEEIKEVLAQAIAKLPEKEKLVTTLYYYEGLTLKEIGKVIGVSESRVSQLHTKAILRLRGHLSRKKKGLISLNGRG
ncbi:MAG: FliA/WhiG family RNA polymerase sigma factor [Firmicutes bacterium]|nr:FliA/WhiG family RNA polymerase sigma factor [Bacillota bacterium]